MLISTRHINRPLGIPVESLDVFMQSRAFGFDWRLAGSEFRVACPHDEIQVGTDLLGERLAGVAIRAYSLHI